MLHEFIQKTICRSIDVDKSFGNQCWDLFAYYTLLSHDKVFGCTHTGYVSDLINYYDDNISQCFDLKISPQVGDWAIWGSGNSVLSGQFIALVLNVGRNSLECLCQWPGELVQVKNIPYEGIIGYLRDKANTSIDNIIHK